MKLPVVVPVLLGPGIRQQRLLRLVAARGCACRKRRPRSTAIARPFPAPRCPADTITALRVAEWNDTANDAKVLEVKRNGLEWTIPSKFDYPADANARVSTAAATYLGLTRGRLVTDDATQYETLGVLDPLDKDVTKRKGRGKRVTMTDSTGKVVCDLIIGEKCPIGDGTCYVREMESAKVYTAQVDAGDLSTAFTDYVKVDPLKIKKDDIRSLTIADYSLDIKNRDNQLLLRATTDLRREGTTDVWDATSAVPDGKQVAQGIINGIINSSTAIKLTDVHLIQGVRDLMAHGIYPVEPNTIQDNSPLMQLGDASGQAKDYEVIGTEGRLDITAKDGLVYSLMFGGAAVDSEIKDAKTKTPPAEDPAKGAHDRYVVVFVRYVPALDEVAKEEAGKPATKKDPDEAKKESGQVRAAKAQKRFLKYFYVISDDAFKQLRPTLDKLFENKPPEATVGKTGKSVSAWLADNAKRPGVFTTADGLQYEILTPARKDGKPRRCSGDQVNVHYKGTLLTDGTEFDSAEGEKTFTTAVTRVIPAWIEMLQLMHEGEQVRIWARPELAYGSRAAGKIPANSTLVFEIERLIKVVGTGIVPRTSGAPRPRPTSLPRPRRAVLPQRQRPPRRSSPLRQPHLRPEVGSTPGRRLDAVARVDDGALAPDHPAELTVALATAGVAQDAGRADMGARAEAAHVAADDAGAFRHVERQGEHARLAEERLGIALRSTPARRQLGELLLARTLLLEPTMDRDPAQVPLGALQHPGQPRHPVEGRAHGLAQAVGVLDAVGLEHGDAAEAVAPGAEEGGPR